MLRYKWIKLTLLVCTLLGFSQNPEGQSYRYISIRGHKGKHMYTGADDTKNVLKHGYNALEVKVGWQSTEKQDWAKYYNYPSYGMGWYSGSLGAPEIFGRPNALYGFINFPISSDQRKNIFNIEPSLGLTYNLEPYDTQDNPLNEAIGARMAVYASIKLGFDYKVNRELNIEYGIDFTHFSNGRTFTPNYGLNMVGIHLGMKYHYNPKQNNNKDIYLNEKLLPIRYKRPNSSQNYKVEQPHSINIYIAGSTVQTDQSIETGNRYGTFSGIAEYQYRINNVHGVSAGIDYFYDGSSIEDFPSQPEKRNQIATHFGYDFMFYKFTIIGQIGYYLNPIPTKTKYFFRPALRYDISKKIYTQIGLKGNGSAADWVEFGIGFRPFKW